jgi:hypothetical protein
MIARRMSFIERLKGPTSPVKILHGAVPKSSEFIYHRWAEDHWWYTINAIVDAQMKAPEGVNLTTEGLQGVVDAISTATLPFVQAGVIAPNFTVEATPIADVPAGELAIGDFATTGQILATATITPKLRQLKVRAEFSLAPV